MMRMSSLFRISREKLLFVFLVSLLTLLVSRSYRFLSFGDEAVLLLLFLSIVLRFKSKQTFRISEGEALLLVYFILFAIFSSFSDTQNLFFYKLQLLMLCTVLLFDLQQDQWSKLLTFNVAFVCIVGILLFVRPQLYMYYDFNIVGDDYFLSFDIKFPPTFSLIRASSTMASSNELSAFLGLFLLFRAGRIHWAFELLVVFVIVITQSRTGLLLLFIYYAMALNFWRTSRVVVLALIGVSMLAYLGLYEDVMYLSRFYGGSEGASTSSLVRLSALQDATQAGFFPWEGSNNLVTPHAVWLWHVDQLGVLSGFVFGVSVSYILAFILRKRGWGMFLGVVVVSLTDPNLMLLPTFIFLFIVIDKVPRYDHAIL